MDHSVFVIETERKKEIDAFNLKNLEDLKRNYFVEREDLSKEKISQREKLAKKIYNNFNNMSFDELVVNSNLCTNEKEHKRRLLTFELKYYKCEPVSMTLLEFKKRAFAILNRYQSKAGGNRIEDLDWTVYTSDDDVEGRVVMENELLFENSICKCDVDDPDTNKYLNYIVKRLTLLSNDIDVEIRFSDDNGIT